MPFLRAAGTNNVLNNNINSNTPSMLRADLIILQHVSEA